MKRVAGYIVSAILGVVIVGGAALPAAYADSSGLSIPPRKNYLIKPGESKTDKLTIGNLNSNQELKITLKVVDFTFRDETGTPRLNLADNAPQTTWSLKPFVQLPKTFTVPPGQRKTVEMTVKIPDNQGAGSYYSALQYVATGPNGENVNVSASGVTLVFVSVPGVVNEKLTLTKLGAYQPNNSGSGKFLFIATDRPPQQIGYTMKNDGNVTENPAGSITIKPAFFGKTINIDNINPNTSLALIGQNRLFTTCIQKEDKVVELQGEKSISSVCKEKPSIWPGLYKITLNAFYGQNGNQSREVAGTATFWYLPWWFTIPLLAIIAAIVFYVRKFIRKVKGASSPGGYRSSNRKPTGRFRRR